jgi:predicted GH43/DUF377 family glycosyl hydrolase
MRRETGPGYAEAESLFRAALNDALAEAAGIGEADVVVGVPFYNEVDTLASVLQTAADGLVEYFPSSKCALVAVGGPAGREALDAISGLPKPDGIDRIAFLLDNERISGKGWAVWAIMEIARSLGADLAILEADLRSREADGDIEGLAPDWVNLLIEPIRESGMDLVAPRFTRHYLESPLSSLVYRPVMTTVYDCPMHDLAGGQWGISYRLLRTLLQKSPLPPSVEAGGWGIDAWLATSAAAMDARVCEANLGIKIHRPSVAKAEVVLTQAARVLFDQAAAFFSEPERAAVSGQPMVRPLPVFGARKPHVPDPVPLTAEPLVEKFQQGFSRFRALYQWVLPGDTYGLLETLSETDAREFRFPHRLWADFVYHLLLASNFTREFAEGDLVGSFTTAYTGYLAGYVRGTELASERLRALDEETGQHLVALEAESQAEQLVREFVRLKPDFLAAWDKQAEDLMPPVPNVTYREFIPGVPLIVPLELTAPGGSIVTANAVYESLFHRQHEQFQDFVHSRLGVPAGAGSEEIAGDFLLKVESEIADTLLSSDPTTVAGTRSMAKTILRYFRRQDGYAIAPEMTSWLLWRYPPVNLITRLGRSYLNQLLAEYQPNDILALASWTEDHDYRVQVGALIRESLRPEHLAPSPLEAVVVDIEDFPSLAEMKETPSLSRLAGRVVLSNLRKGMGGEMPLLRYLTTLAKSVIEVERFAEIWAGFATERKDFAEKVVNALEGHWGKTPLSAHNIFENGHQIVFVERLREMAAQVALEVPHDEARVTLAAHLKDVADSYHLFQTLPDGTFVPCSAWTWASYSFKGGTGVPTPLSLHVERDWSSREYLLAYYEAIGGDLRTMDSVILELMAQGREYEDLTPLLLGGIQGAEQVIQPTSPPIEEHPPAKDLVRFLANPVLSPVKEHDWECKYLLNPGAMRLNGKVYLVYRAVGDDDISRLGLAVSDDGFEFNERLAEPIFEPKTLSEAKGCEDPRLTVIDERVYMAYTAYSSPIAQIAVASIGVEDFVNYHWGAWHRHGLVFPGFTDKDAAFFPGQFGGKFAMLHRVDPHIWISFSTHMRCPWPRKEHKILAGSRPGMVWDSLKIGGGSQPIETRYGWLMIYHGVDHNHVYRLGVMLLDREDPTILLYRSPNSVLEPVEEFEIGDDGESWVPNVVFTCGAVPREEGRTVLGARDEILVYYGAADSVIGVATARVEDLIPAEFR